MITTEPAPGAAAETRIAAVRRRPARLQAFARGTALLWRREMVRIRHSPIRLAMGLVTPLLFLLVLGTGLDAASGLGSAQMHDYRAFLFPGTCIMAIQAPSVAVGISLVWDRRMGLLRQMLVSPFPRSSIILGLACGGATTGAIYGLMLLVVSGIAGIHYTPALLLVLLELFLISFMFTAVGLLVAVTIRQIDAFQVIVNLSLMPLMFFSGAIFPPNGLPGWLSIVVKLNPLTYGVDAVRRTLPGEDMLGSKLTSLMIRGWTPPVPLELGFLAAIGLIAVAVSAFRFSRSA
jgi:ABC-2 type transport system permease protein